MILAQDIVKKYKYHKITQKNIKKHLTNDILLCIILIYYINKEVEMNHNEPILDMFNHINELILDIYNRIIILEREVELLKNAKF